MADRAPRRGALPMSGARLTAALECANDAGVRFTLRRPGDSHGASRLSAGAAASCASTDRPASAARAALTGTGATPQSEGLVRVRRQVCLRTPAPVPSGSLPANYPYAGRRFSAASRRRSTRLVNREAPARRVIGSERPERQKARRTRNRPSGEDAFSARSFRRADRAVHHRGGIE